MADRHICRYFSASGSLSFYKLVVNHHSKLYGPGDFRNDEGFLKTLSTSQREERLNEEVADSLGEARNVNHFLPVAHLPEEEPNTETSQRIDREQFRRDVINIEENVVNKISSELGVTAERQVGIGGTKVAFDAFLGEENGEFRFLEVRVLRTPMSTQLTLDRILYQAMVANDFFVGRFKLILTLVHYLSGDEEENAKRQWERRIAECPANIELRFYSRDEILGD